MTRFSSDPAAAGPPTSAQIEISIFGPGKGECVALHAGAGDWLIIDSCIDQFSRKQPALQYLESIGVNLGTQVKLVLATHAHDDHLAGISDVFEAAVGSTLVVSAASTSEEFYAAMEADAEIESTLRQSIRREYRQLLDLAERRAAAQDGWRPLKRAVEGLNLWSRPADTEVPAAWARSLSPSHHAVSRAQNILAAGTARSDSRRRLSASDPNEFAVALWVQVGDAAVLLGADLLAGPAACGWHAVIETFEPPIPASYFKVPHHGAPNAHHDDVWDKLLRSEPVATLAPYRAGVTPRPSENDVDRLNGLTPNAFATANPRRPAPRKAVRRASATLAQVAQNVRDPWGISGHVRTRGLPTDEGWRTEIFGPAMHL